MDDAYRWVRAAGRRLVQRDPVLEATQAAGDTPVQSPAASNHTVNNAAYMIFIRSQEDGMIRSVRRPRTTSRS
ncbi:MAG TPA: hypothetical protein VGL20_09800 [Candidatus Dormibacteraeota bacterium]